MLKVEVFKIVSFYLPGVQVNLSSIVWSTGIFPTGFLDLVEGILPITGKHTHLGGYTLIRTYVASRLD